MASFGQLKLTDLGIMAQLNAQDGKPLKFTKIGVGSGVYAGDVTQITKLVKEEVLVGIDNAYMEDNVYTVSGSFSNENLETSFVWREIGLYFEDESGNNVLYCYANAGDRYDVIPATTDSRYTKTVRVATAISNAENVSIESSSGTVYVEVAPYEKFKKEVETHMEAQNPHGTQASDVGALPIIDAQSEKYDMTAILQSGEHLAMYKTSSKTLGTPYKASVTPFANADILSYGTAANYGMQFAFMSGGLAYTRSLKNGVLSEWTTGFMPLTGGTMAGLIDMAGNGITGLPNAVNDTDALALAFAKTLFASNTLVENAISVASEADLDSQILAIMKTMPEQSVRFVYVNNSSANVFGASRCIMVLTKIYASGDNSQGTVDFWVTSGTGTFYKLRKLVFNTTVHPIEWDNPPMALGVEYRTTERYNGGAVYVRLDSDGYIHKRSEGGADLTSLLSGFIRLNTYYLSDNDSVLGVLKNNWSKFPNGKMFIIYANVGGAQSMYVGYKASDLYGAAEQIGYAYGVPQVWRNVNGLWYLGTSQQP